MKYLAQFLFTLFTWPTACPSNHRIRAAVLGEQRKVNGTAKLPRTQCTECFSQANRMRINRRDKQIVLPASGFAAREYIKFYGVMWSERMLIPLAGPPA